MEPVEITLQESDDRAMTLVLTGSWKLGEIGLSAEKVYQRLTSATGPTIVKFDSSQLIAWDSGLLTYIKRLRTLCTTKNMTFESSGLPAGVKKITNSCCCCTKDLYVPFVGGHDETDKLLDRRKHDKYSPNKPNYHTETILSLQGQKLDNSIADVASVEDDIYEKNLQQRLEKTTLRQIFSGF